MNIEEITSSLKKNGNAGVHSNLTVEYSVSTDSKDINKNAGKSNTLFNPKMAEVSQLLVFEEIYIMDNNMPFIDIEDRVYKRYENILNNSNPDFIFSLKMPFLDWIKLQIELEHIIVNIIDGKSMLSLSKPVEELLKTKLDDLYLTTCEKQDHKNNASAV